MATNILISLEFNEKTGTLIINYNDSGTKKTMSKTLKNPEWIKIYQAPEKKANPDGPKVWKIDTDYMQGDPNYFTKMPFGRHNPDTIAEFSTMAFGIVFVTADVNLITQYIPENKEIIEFGTEKKLHIALGFIGTDDMRNGRAPQQLIDIDGKDLYLHLRPTPVEYRYQDNDYELILGFKAKNTSQ